MSKALAKYRGSNRARGVVSGVASAVVPGLGQLLNGDKDKAIGVFVVAAVSGAGWLGAIPLIGGIAGTVWGVTWLYGVADGYLTGKKKD